MKLKLSDISLMSPALTNLIKQEDVKLPVRTSFKLSKIIKTLSNELSSVEETKIKLFKKYGSQNEDGQLQILPETEEHENFIRELGELMSEEVDLDIKPISIDDLGDINISVKDMLALSHIIEETAKD